MTDTLSSTTSNPGPVDRSYPVRVRAVPDSPISRVGCYAYGVLGTDRHPPFSLAEEPDYPATLTVEYPERLSRGLALVKWWLLAIPHYLILALLFGGGTWFSLQFGDRGWAMGLSGVGVLVLVAALAPDVHRYLPPPVVHHHRRVPPRAHLGRHSPQHSLRLSAPGCCRA